MSETMPKLNREPIKSEEGELGFKVEDRRRPIDEEKISKEIEEEKTEKERKRFDSMTPEQREELEYNRDKERGFTVKDRRPVFDRIEPKPNQEDQEKIEEVKKQIETMAPESGKVEKPVLPESDYHWKDRLDAYNNELKVIEKDFKDAKLGAMTILGFKAVANELKVFQQKFEKYAESELGKHVTGAIKDHLIDEFAKISQKITDMNEEIKNSDITRSYNPFRGLRKPFKKIGGLFKRK